MAGDWQSKKTLIKYCGNHSLWEVPAFNVHAFNFYLQNFGSLTEAWREAMRMHGTRHTFFGKIAAMRTANYRPY